MKVEFSLLIGAGYSLSCVLSIKIIRCLSDSVQSFSYGLLFIVCCFDKVPRQLTVAQCLRFKFFLFLFKSVLLGF